VPILNRPTEEHIQIPTLTLTVSNSSGVLPRADLPALGLRGAILKLTYLTDDLLVVGRLNIPDREQGHRNEKFTSKLNYCSQDGKGNFISEPAVV